MKEATIVICDIVIPVLFISASELNEEYKKGVIKRSDCELLGLANFVDLKIYIREGMHEYATRKTLIHEATHILTKLKNEVIEQIEEVDLHELLSVYVSENISELYIIHKQVESILKRMS